ncbi:MAG: type I-C CRISPR-associated protein Cas7/Csd2 [Acidobacteria bacterium]|nr:type I-C CRISPR-associated protein Cas7/Csd2 [Acidobacteriota bacterium]
MSNNILTNRHDFLLLFEVTNGNPNGDPDAGNMPRLDPNTSRGIVTDVCLKRKVRNYVEMFPPARPTPDANGFGIFIKQGPALERTINKAVEENDKKPEAAVRWLCREFFDIRSFGGVLGVGHEVMKGSAYGQLRGPVQFTFAQSYHPITPLEVTITRCVQTTVEDEKKERTMGNKHIVPYALYAAKGYISPAFAERTGFTTADLDLLFQAIQNMFEHDRSAARGEMIVRGVYDFEHVGTQHPNNADQNRREARLGCHHAHKLLEGISVTLRDGKSFPESFADYDMKCEWTAASLPKGIKLNILHEGRAIGPRQG